MNYKVHSCNLAGCGVICRPTIRVGDLRNDFGSVVHDQLENFIVLPFAKFHRIYT